MTAARYGLEALTEREKATLRLIVRGHDAKSIARHLGLSVHTINERLREARRKLAVSSSREAARLLFEAEGGAAIPEPVADSRIGEAAAAPREHSEGAPATGAGRRSRLPWPLAGVALMTPLIVAVALAAGLQLATPQAAATDAPKPAVVEAAQRFLALVDGARWAESYDATGASFHKLNTLAAWTAASEQVRAELGAAGTRMFLSEEQLPAPPAGYEVVKFRTDYANKAGAVETVSLVYEGGMWRVAGILIG